MRTAAVRPSGCIGGKEQHEGLPLQALLTQCPACAHTPVTPILTSPVYLFFVYLLRTPVGKQGDVGTSRDGKLACFLKTNVQLGGRGQLP